MAKNNNNNNNNSSKGSKSVRKPLLDISNGGGKSLKQLPSSNNNKKKISSSSEEEDCQDQVLDRLLLAHSDLSNLIHQIDELVAQAFKVKLASKKERKEIESFTNVLSDIHSSLKAWVPRFQKALSSPSVESVNDLGQSFPTKAVPTAIEETSDAADSPEQLESPVSHSPLELESLVSPSPLVSWCADRTVESGRQLFLLTPLPRSKAFSSKHHGSSRSIFERITHVDEHPNTTFELPSISVTKKENTVECGFVSPPKTSNRDRSVLLMTPRLKMSPPKSCVLLEPISESFHHNFNDFRKSTPYPFGSQYSSSSQSSEPSSSHASESLALKYPELFGIKQTHKPGVRTEKEISMDWLMSPPKSCVLMEPPEEQLSHSLATKDGLSNIQQMLNQSTSLAAAAAAAAANEEYQAAYKSIAKSCNKEPLIANATLVESTPMWKDPGSVIPTGKHRGENTLKKELWTRFEAASSNVIRFDVSVLQETSTKGFLDRLEEVSCER